MLLYVFYGCWKTLKRLKEGVNEEKVQNSLNLSLHFEKMRCILENRHWWLSSTLEQKWWGLIEKFEKTLKIDLTNTLKCGILRNVASFRGLAPDEQQCWSSFKKVWKKLIIRLDKREKLWYIKQPSNSLRVWQLIENWIVRCEPWNSLENSRKLKLEKNLRANQIFLIK